MRKHKMSYQNMRTYFLISLAEPSYRKFIEEQKKHIFEKLVLHEHFFLFPQLQIEFLNYQKKHEDDEADDWMGKVNEGELAKGITKIYINFGDIRRNIDEKLEKLLGENCSSNPRYRYLLVTLTLEEINEVITHELAHLYQYFSQDLFRYVQIIPKKLTKEIEHLIFTNERRGYQTEATILNLYGGLRISLLKFFTEIHIEGFAMFVEGITHHKIDYTSESIHGTYNDGLIETIRFKQQFDQLSRQLAFFGRHGWTEEGVASFIIMSKNLFTISKTVGYEIGLHVYHVLGTKYSFVELVKWKPKRILDAYVKQSKSLGLKPLISYDQGSSHLSYKAALNILILIRSLTKESNMFETGTIFEKIQNKFL